MPKFRIAPTPSGFLHRGNGYNFWLIQQAQSRLAGATLLLRIDDLDADRKRPEYVEDIFDTLRWMHIEWHEGPQNLQDFEENWSQRHRLPLYLDALDQLRRKQLLFACRKSRADLAPYGGQYPAEFRQQPWDLDQPDVAWRVKTPPHFPLPDFVVRRRDGLPAYQIASLCDDVFFQITHIIRGEDLRPSTQAQIWLAEQLGYTTFLRITFEHHPLLVDATGTKLSKSAHAHSLRALRQSAISFSPEIFFH